MSDEDLKLIEEMIRSAAVDGHQDQPTLEQLAKYINNAIGKRITARVKKSGALQSLTIYVDGKITINHEQKPENDNVKPICKWIKAIIDTFPDDPADRERSVNPGHFIPDLARRAGSETPLTLPHLRRMISFMKQHMNFTYQTSGDNVHFYKGKRKVYTYKKKKDPRRKKLAAFILDWHTRVKQQVKSNHTAAAVKAKKAKRRGKEKRTR